jgi:thioredoxin-like negative regulator of GroEL
MIYHTAKVASIDCTENKEACSKNGIRGYPTLLYFIDGQPQKYAGQRTQEAIIDFLNNKPSEVRAGK